MPEPGADGENHHRDHEQRYRPEQHTRCEEVLPEEHNLRSPRARRS